MHEGPRRTSRAGRRHPHGAGLLALSWCLLLASCENTVVSVIELSDLELSPSSVTLLEGEEQPLRVVVIDAEGATLADPALTWKVADTDVATVTAAGVVQARAPGRTTVEASSGGVAASTTVVVLAGPTLRLRPESITVETDDDETVTRTVEIENTGNGNLDGLSARVEGQDASSWLTAEVLDASAPTELRLRLRPGDMETGEHEALVVVESTASSKGPAEVRVRLRVREAASGGGDQEERDDDEEEREEEDDDDEEEGDGAPCVLRNRVHFGHLEISRGTTCVLTNVRVLGNVRLRRDARLEAREVRIHGNLRAGRADELVLVDVVVHGRFRHENGGDVSLRDSYVDGNVTLRDNRGTIEIRESRFGRHVELRDNRGGPFRLIRNVISGRLDCRGNRPAPLGDGNRADGGERRQCRGL